MLTLNGMDAHVRISFVSAPSRHMYDPGIKENFSVIGTNTIGGNQCSRNKHRRRKPMFSGQTPQEETNVLAFTALLVRTFGVFFF